MIGRLPTSLEAGGTEWPIRTDYRDILTIMEAYNDPDLSDREKAWVMLHILFVDWEAIPPEARQEAGEQAIWFLDCGQTDDGKKPPRKLMDWEQDAPILFPAINKVAGREVRAAEYMHWWTFMGLFMEIEDGTFSHVLNIRQKMAKGKPLEKHEREFYQSNKALCVIKTRYTAEEQAEIDYWNKLLGQTPEGV